MGKEVYSSNNLYFLVLACIIILLLVTFSVHGLEEDLKVKHSTKTIQSEDGDIIDCVDIYKQPTFDHPALKNHVIQMAPSTYNQLEEEPPTMKNRKEEALNTNMTVSQVWQRSGKSCPKGTIPIRRMIKENGFLHHSIRKKQMYHHPMQHLNQQNNKDIISLQQPNCSQAVLLTMGYNYAGVKGDIKVWNPHIDPELEDDYSSSLVRLKSGPYFDFECIEFGWMVYPKLYGDSQTRLYIYWTLDASNTTGCFDLTCPGFIQTSSEITIGTAINSISDLSNPYAITVFIFRDPATDNLWVQYGEKTNIGYWPASLFGSLSHGAEVAEWGGEVRSIMVGDRTPHTGTHMGNGRFPDMMLGDSGIVTRIRVLDISLNLKAPEWAYVYTDEFRCYDAFYLDDYVEDPEFYYGGPGQDHGFCP